jgi:hypothetical protein
LIVVFKRSVLRHIMLCDNFMDVDDYFVVIVNVNQYLLWKHLHA